MQLNSTNPKKAYGIVKPSAQFIPPIAIVEESAVMALGASKYGAFNWQDSPVDGTTYYSAAIRHLMAWFAGEDIDPESGASHLAHVRACCGILMDSQASGILVDDRPKTSHVGDAIRRLSQKQAPKWDQAAEIAQEATEKAAEVDANKRNIFESWAELTPHPIIRDAFEYRLSTFTKEQLENWIVKPGCDCNGCEAAELYRVRVRADEAEAARDAFGQNYRRSIYEWKLHPDCPCRGCTDKREYVEKFGD